MRFLAAVLMLVSSVAALPTFTRHAPPTGWAIGDRASGDAPVSFTIALQQRNLDELHSRFVSVSDPASPAYRAFLSQADVLALVQPDEKHRVAVKSWLAAHGVRPHDIDDMGDALDVKTSVSVATSLFRTFFHEYRSVSSPSVSVVRSFGTYSVDDEIAPYIHMVTGISTFPIPHLRPQKSKRGGGGRRGGRAAPLASDQGVVAQTLQALYGLPSKLGLSGNTSQAVIEFEGQNYTPSDLTTYGQEVNRPVLPYSAAHTVGPNDPTAPGTESTLDVDMIATVNNEADNWFWIEGGNGWLYQFAAHFFSTTEVPQVLSISYGWSEADQCSINSSECASIGVDNIAYVQRVNTEFQKIGLRGVSILSASGDSGANGRTDGACSSQQLFPDFPGSSPYVTSVGATELANPVYALSNPPPICTTTQGYQCPSGGNEQAVSFAISNFASGGGFSNIAVRPSWQQAAVDAYLSSGVPLPPSSYFNATSRGYPDLAAIGHNNLIYQQGNVQAVGGTSAATPIWAGVIALLNQAAVAADGKPLGFLNPLLYSIAASDPSAFRDITVGDNKCTEQGCASTCQGFVATQGWDPVTGLGAPNFPVLLKNIQAKLSQ